MTEDDYPNIDEEMNIVYEILGEELPHNWKDIEVNDLDEEGKHDDFVTEIYEKYMEKLYEDCNWTKKNLKSDVRNGFRRILNDKELRLKADNSKDYREGLVLAYLHICEDILIAKKQN